MERLMTATTPDLVEQGFVVQHEVLTRTTIRQRVVSGILLILLGAVTVQFLALELKAGRDAHLKIDAEGSAGSLPNLVLPARYTALALGIVVIALGCWQLARGFRRQAMPWVLTVAFVAFMVAFLCWVSARGEGITLDILGLLQNTVALSVPLILGALAGVLCERSGVINVAIEGQMLAGAWAAALVGSLTTSYLGLVGAVAAGALMGVLLAIFAIKYLVNQVVLGVVLNVLALGLTGFFYDAFMQPNTQELNSPTVLKDIDIPGLSHIPVIGPLLFQANIVVYLAYVLIIVVDVALFRTRWGLRTRAVGEHPKAADTVGIKVLAMRYRNVVLGGAVAGLGGAYFTVGAVGAFGKNITSGNGFIALAALIFGRWSPRGAVGAALLFGFASALQTLLSISVPSIPSNFLAMLPYLATILAVAGLVGRVRAPAADGEPYVKG
jgi:simple sugar transport system permease protein